MAELFKKCQLVSLKQTGKRLQYTNKTRRGFEPPRLVEVCPHLLVVVVGVRAWLSADSLRSSCR